MHDGISANFKAIYKSPTNFPMLNLTPLYELIHTFSVVFCFSVSINQICQIRLGNEFEGCRIKSSSIRERF